MFKKIWKSISEFFRPTVTNNGKKKEVKLKFKETKLYVYLIFILMEPLPCILTGLLLGWMCKDISHPIMYCSLLGLSIWWFFLKGKQQIQHYIVSNNGDVENDQ
jgi:hypothetical protein